MSQSVADTLNAGMADLIPIVEKMGIKVVEARPGFAAATAPFEGNGNHFGVIYAGVQFTLAEMLGGVIALASFDTEKYFPLVKGLDITFSKMAATELRAEVSMDDATLARVAEEAAANGKSDYTLDAVVTDANGVVVATTHGLYQLRAHRN